MPAEAHEDRSLRPRRAKVCFVGEREVGKTSLIRRYVLDAFDEAYVATLGARVTKVYAILEDESAAMELILWDVMGAPGFRELLQEAYFHGAEGVVAVCDLTRRPSMWQLASWLRAVEAITKPVAKVLVGNKADLAAERQVDSEELREFSASLGCHPVEASAKTGRGVADVFNVLLRQLLSVSRPSETLRAPRERPSPWSAEPSP
jgi:small GTP-binding protein